jgi:hypothetical protein
MGVNNVYTVSLECRAMHQSRKRTTDEMKRSNRTVLVPVRISPEEKKAFDGLAERLGTTLSELMRQGVYRALKAEKEGKAA